MPDAKPDLSDPSQLRQMALSTWDNEGGAGPCGPQEGLIHSQVQSGVPELTNTELVQLRIRVIALENLVIALLARKHLIGSSTLLAKWRPTSLQGRASPLTL